MGYSPEHYQANKEKYALKSKAWRENNPEKAKENRRAYYEAHKEKELSYSTSYNRLKKVGITKEQYSILLEKQKGVCVLCGEAGSRALAADHCHTTGKIRGLLCSNCNRGLGYFKDNQEVLKLAIEYLKND